MPIVVGPGLPSPSNGPLRAIGSIVLFAKDRRPHPGIDFLSVLKDVPLSYVPNHATISASSIDILQPLSHEQMLSSGTL